MAARHPGARHPGAVLFGAKGSSAGIHIYPRRSLLLSMQRGRRATSRLWGRPPRARRLKAPGLLLRVRVGVSHALQETYTTRSAAHRSHGQSYDPVVTAARLRRAHVVGRNIRLARLTAGLSQRELAELVGSTGTSFRTGNADCTSRPSATSTASSPCSGTTQAGSVGSVGVSFVATFEDGPKNGPQPRTFMAASLPERMWFAPERRIVDRKTVTHDGWMLVGTAPGPGPAEPWPGQIEFVLDRPLEHQPRRSRRGLGTAVYVHVEAT